MAKTADNSRQLRHERISSELNPDNPMSVDEEAGAYNKGYDDFQKDKDVTENPYDWATQKKIHLAWERGWEEANQDQNARSRPPFSDWDEEYERQRQRDDMSELWD